MESSNQEIIFDVEEDIVAETNFSLTENAITKLQQVKQTAPDTRLRVRVLAGGCSGFQYEFILEKFGTPKPQDFIITGGDVEIAVDKISASFLQNAQLDYTASLAGENFQITNPNAVNSCGCGTSFSIA